MKKNIAVYSGSFDPITNGHLDIIKRASKLFDSLIVLITKNQNKTGFFNIQEREQIVKEVVEEFKNVQVDTLEQGLLVDYLKEKNIKVIVRGIRGVGDLETEMTNAHYNKSFYPEVETLFLPCSLENTYISSSAVKEIIKIGGDIRKLVPLSVIKAINKKP